MLNKLKNPKVRQQIYTIAAAVMPLLVLYGLISSEQATGWLAVVGALLGTGSLALAAANTKERKL